MAVERGGFGGASAATPRARVLELREWASMSLILTQGPSALLGFVFPFALGVSSGGYWPTSWGWAALAFFWICALVLLMDSEVRLGPGEAVLPGALLALAAWDIASSLWGSSLTQPMLETQLALVYVGGTLTALVVVRRGTYRSLLGGTAAAITVICAYSLATRLFPERLGSIDNFAENRLAQPLGYWNALGMFAALGMIVALGFSARGRGHTTRALAGASTVILAPTLYFTFGRGGWIALGLGLAAAVAVDRRRLQLLAAALALAPWPVLAVWFASRPDALTHQGARLAAVSQAGHRYAFQLAVLLAGAAASMWLLSALGRRVIVTRAAALAFQSVLVLAAAALLGAALVRFGSPVSMARHAYGSFLVRDRPAAHRDLNSRLLTLANTGRIPWWRVARSEYRLHPWLGSGAGSYERYWNQLRPVEGKVRNAHNLYLETLAETGPVGLALLLAGLLAPFAAVRRARRRSLGAVACGAYVAFLADAALDWSWEMPAVTVTALFCAVALLAAGRGERPMLGRAVWLGLIAASLALAALAFVGLQGNRALAAGEDAAGRTEWKKAAADARSGIRWAPWSAVGWQRLGEAQFQEGRTEAARVSFLRAISRDDADWSIWLDLALASRGTERQHAFAEAARLNPLGSAIKTYRAESAGARGPGRR